MMTQDYQNIKEPGFAAYHAKAENGPPRATLLAALDAFAAERAAGPRLAVDLGCGTGRDTMALLRRGWPVLAIDREPDALGRLRARAAAERLPAPATLAADFSSLALPSCALVNASFCLFLCRPEAFPALWQRILGALQPGGRVACQLLGPRDQWAGQPGITSHDRLALGQLLAGLEVALLEEEETDAVTPRGRQKHWHLWHLVARRPPSGAVPLSAG